MTVSTIAHDRPPGAGAELFSALFEQHSRAVYNYLFRRTGDWAVAEDLTSVVFLEAFRRRDDVDLRSVAPLPWLYGVATNVLHNERRSRRRHRAALARVPDPRPTEDFAGDVAQRLDDQRRVAVLLQRIAALTQGEQDVLTLCAWQGLSYEEASLALDVPIGTVRSRLSRARGRLNDGGAR